MGGRGSSSMSAVGSKAGRRADGTVELQGIGVMNSVSAKNVKVGDHIMYNYGETARVTKVENVGKESVRITERSRGKEHSRIRRKYSQIVVDAVNPTMSFMRNSGGF